MIFEKWTDPMSFRQPRGHPMIQTKINKLSESCQYYDKSVMVEPCRLTCAANSWRLSSCEAVDIAIWQFEDVAETCDALRERCSVLLLQLESFAGNAVGDDRLWFVLGAAEC
jgi:hypothetical protein